VHRLTLEDGARPGSDQLTIGPPEDLVQRDSPRARSALAWCGPDARLLAVCDHDTGRIQAFRVRPAISREWVSTVPHVMYLSSSADGRWLAAGTEDGGRGVSILDAGTGKVVRELPLGDAMAVFSPVGPWLVTTTGRLTTPEGECCLWRAGSWEKVLARPLSRTTSSPATITISHDGRILAIARTESDVQLLHLETLEEIATLSSPEPGYVAYMAFSSDGRWLAAGVANTVQLWDLQGLRKGLAPLGLDWEQGLERAAER
jgi:WD40 repeat protein